MCRPNKPYRMQCLLLLAALFLKKMKKYLTFGRVFGIIIALARFV